MLVISELYSLRNRSTFRLDALARYFAELEYVIDWEALMASPIFNTHPKLILGGGSNMLFTKDFDGLVIHPNFKGIEKADENQDNIFVKAMAGENWDAFVAYCVDNNWAGAENLSLIPGNVGSSPVQNIGAFGVELKDIFYSLDAIHIETGKKVQLNYNDCAFGYRDSIFKHVFKQQYVVVSVVFKLNKTPKLNLTYEPLVEKLKGKNIHSPTISDVREAVCEIRCSKLPDPTLFGNAGSFFKNPTVEASHYSDLISRFPDLKAFPQENASYKLAAAWLIEACGWKGYRKKDAGVHQKQALVLVNYGKASGKEIVELANEIELSVYEKFKIQLEKEVNLI